MEKEINIGKLAVSKLEEYVLSKNQYEESVKKLDASKNTHPPEERSFQGSIYHWDSLPSKITDLTILVDITFYYKQIPSQGVYDISILRVFFRPKPKKFQFGLKAKQKISPDYIDFDKTMKDKEEFVLTLCQNYKENGVLFKKPVFGSNETHPGVFIKESHEHEAENQLVLDISCCQYFLDCRENRGLSKTFSKNELVALINNMINDYTTGFDKLKKSDFNFKRLREGGER